MTIIPIVTGAFGTVSKGLLKGLEDLEVGRHYWEWPEYWEESWRLEETCCHSDSSERPLANADVKNSNGQVHYEHYVMSWNYYLTYEILSHKTLKPTDFDSNNCLMTLSVIIINCFLCICYSNSCKLLMLNIMLQANAQKPILITHFLLGINVCHCLSVSLGNINLI